MGLVSGLLGASIDWGGGGCPAAPTPSHTATAPPALHEGKGGGGHEGLMRGIRHEHQGHWGRQAIVQRLGEGGGGPRMGPVSGPLTSRPLTNIPQGHGVAPPPPHGGGGVGV